MTPIIRFVVNVKAVRDCDFAILYADNKASNPIIPRIGEHITSWQGITLKVVDVNYLREEFDDEGGKCRQHVIEIELG
jgi:hypothetical protein